MSDFVFGHRAASTLETFGRQPWRKQPPAEAARRLLEGLDPFRARKMSRYAQALARRSRSRRHFDYWSEVDAALCAETAGQAFAGAALAEPLLEEQFRVRVVVEAGDLAPAGLAVERSRFRQSAVGVEP